MDERDLRRLAARGTLAGAVTGELARPLAHASEVLGQLVDRLDRHVAHARGPEPLSWSTVGELRQKLADLFLDVGRVRRLASDLALLGPADGERRPAATDGNELVERALSLSRHRFGEDQDVLLDLATVPPVEVDATRLVQALALLFIEVSESAGPGATIVVRTSPPDGAGAASVSIEFQGTARASSFSAFIAEELRAEGSAFTYTEAEGITTAQVTLRVAK